MISSHSTIATREVSYYFFSEVVERSLRTQWICDKGIKYTPSLSSENLHRYDCANCWQGIPRRLDEHLRSAYLDINCPSAGCENCRTTRHIIAYRCGQIAAERTKGH